MNTRNQERVGTDTETILQQLTKMKEEISLEGSPSSVSFGVGKNGEGFENKFLISICLWMLLFICSITLTLVTCLLIIR